MNNIKEVLKEKSAVAIAKIKSISIKRQSYLYIFFVVVIIILSVFFFTARMFLPDDTVIKNTDLNQTYTLNSTTKIILTDWIYNENKEFMLVKFNLKDVNYNYNYNLDFEAVSRKNISEKLPIKVIYKRLDRYYLLLENIPKDYDSISLRIHQTFDNKDDENTLKVYGDSREMKVDNNLKILSEKEYIVEEKKIEIIKSKQAQDKVTEENNKYQKEIDSIDKIISQMLKEKRYKNNAEILLIDEKIILKEKEKENLNRKIKENINIYIIEEKLIESLTEQLQDE